MNVYTILFYLNEDSSCGCDDHDHEHNHDHNDGCGCGSHEQAHEHNHEHGETCGSDDCGCGHDHGTMRDDSDVIGVIKTLGAWANFMPDSYLVKSEFTADQISEKIGAVLAHGDLLFVTNVDKNNVSSLTPGVVDWIRQ